MSKRFTAFLALALAAGATSPAAAQRLGGQSLVAPRVDLVAPRTDGPPQVRLFIEEVWITLPTGAYRSLDGAEIRVKDGSVVSIADPTRNTRSFEVARIDGRMARDNSVPRLVLLDARGRSAPLPDGRFTTREGVTLVVREGAIVGFGGAR